MNILFTYPTEFNPQRGGVERVTDILCREFVKKGHKVFYLNCYSGKDSYNNNLAESFQLPQENLYSKENECFYYSLLVDKNIDVIINQEGMFEYCRFFTRVQKNNIKLISVIHNNPLLDYEYLWEDLKTLKNGTILEKLKRLVRCSIYFRIRHCRFLSLIGMYEIYKHNSSYVSLLSTNYSDNLFTVAPFLKSRTFAIPNPTSFTVNKLDLTIKNKELIFVGRLYNKSKQILKLLHVWKRIQYKTDWKLTIIGDGPDREYIKMKAKKYNLVRISFEGFVNSEPYYKRASIICMTSLFEGFPMVLVEAMQYGCVPIAFNSFAAVSDIIKDNENGFLVEPFDEKTYAEKLLLLMHNNSLRRRFSIQGFDYVQKFNSECIAEQWLDKIENLKPI